MASPKDTHGPIVEKGPNAGNVRSRNKNGQWRKKRSDAGMPRLVWNIIKEITKG